MKNIPRIFVGENIASGMVIPVERSVSHYLTRVMRTTDCLVFGNGNEYSKNAEIVNPHVDFINTKEIDVIKESPINIGIKNDNNIISLFFFISILLLPHIHPHHPYCQIQDIRGIQLYV